MGLPPVLSARPGRSPGAPLPELILTYILLGHFLHLSTMFPPELEVVLNFHLGRKPNILVTIVIYLVFFVATGFLGMYHPCIVVVFQLYGLRTSLHSYIL